MKQYQDLIKETRAHGIRTPNRTGVDAIKLAGAMMRINLEDGFPAITTKKLAFKSVVGELCAFLRACRSAAEFRTMGCKVWDANANEHNADGSKNPWLDNPYRLGQDDLGPVYGVQWREWPGVKIIDIPHEDMSDEAKLRYAAIVDKIKADGWVYRGTVDNLGTPQSVFCKPIDQIAACLTEIIKNPNNRRILFHGWNPSVLDEVALPACHLLYHFLPDSVNGRLNMVLYVRSNDIGLGTPFNLAEGALLVNLFARLAGLKPGTMAYMIGDAHIYDNQTEYLDELLTKEPFPLPTLKINDRVPSYDKADNAKFMDESGDTQIEHLIEWLTEIDPSDFTLEGYQYHTLETPVPKMVI